MTIPNRIVLPPMGTRFTRDSAVSDQMLNFFTRRAEGGAGFSIVSASYVVSAPGGGHVGIWDDRFIAGLNNLAEAIKDRGSRCAIQLQHRGIWAGKGPSDMDREDLAELRRLYAGAARRAVTAGFEAIEVHCAHGFLMNQFLSPIWNGRTDEFGGTLERRARFPMEIFDAIRQEIGDRPLIARLSAEQKVEGGLTIDDTVEISRLMAESAVDALHISCGGRPTTYDWVVQPMAFPRGVLVPFAAQIAEAVDVPVIAVGRISTPELAEEILRDTKIEFIAFGRGLIADPDLPRKAFSGSAEPIRTCTGCNYCHGVRTGEELTLRCAINPEVGHEEDYRPTKAMVPMRVLIAGGGPGGMEAARVLALRGHRPILCEKENRLWATAILSAIPPHKDEWRCLLDYQQRELERLGVEIRLGTKVDAALVREIRPNAVVVATGSKPFIPKGLQALLNKGAVLAEAVLFEQVRPRGNVVVAGGGYVGCEVAEWLVAAGHKVTMLVGRNPKIAYNSEPLTRKGLIGRLEGLGIAAVAGFEIQSFGNGRLSARNRVGEIREFSCDTVVLAVGMLPNQDLADEIGDCGVPIRSIGDCVSPRGIADAIHEGYVAALRL